MSDFIYHKIKGWNVEKLESLVVPEDIPSIQSLTASQSTQNNKFCWNYTQSGHYAVESVY